MIAGIRDQLKALDERVEDSSHRDTKTAEPDAE